MNDNPPISWKERILSEKDPGRSSFIAAIIANIILYYIVNQIPYWNISFITPAWGSVLWAVNLSIVVSILGNIILLIYYRQWFRSIVKALMNVFVIYAIWVLYQIFPFNFTTPGLNLAVQIALIVLLILVMIATLVEIIKLVISVQK
jgi:hypothetical protein